jgi:DNA-binding CsgD family transcriptional regulator
MTYKYNPFAAAYPSDRGPLGKIFQPVIDLRTYLRAGHMLLMFPLGIAYFVLLVVTFSVGGSLIWTLAGPIILLAVLFTSRWIGDLEALMSGYANGNAIRRPPSKLEGVSNFRSQVKVRLVDPTTWTGVIYLFAQFPLGIAAFVGLVVSYSVVGSLILAPFIGVFNDEPIHIISDLGWTYSVDSPVTGLVLTPIGILGLVLVSHMVLAFSSLHGWWAKLMLGSRSTRVSSRPIPSPNPTDDGPPKPSTNAESEFPIAASDSLASNPDPEPELELESPKTATLTPFTPAAVAVAVSPDVPPILVPVPNPSELVSTETQTTPQPNTDAIAELTTREEEVFMLMAHGDTNADIAEELFISEGTVKTHVKRVLSKLYMRDRTQVVVFAYEQHLVIPGAYEVASLENRSYGG